MFRLALSLCVVLVVAVVCSQWSEWCSPDKALAGPPPECVEGCLVVDEYCLRDADPENGEPGVYKVVRLLKQKALDDFWSPWAEPKVARDNNSRTWRRYKVDKCVCRWDDCKYPCAGAYNEKYDWEDITDVVPVQCFEES